MSIKTDCVIVGAGPCGLFQVFELGLLGLKCHVVDSMRVVGGQCAELYPDKPIYDIPGIPVCDAQELVDRLMEQIKPFDAVFHLGEEVTHLEKHESGFKLTTIADTVFDAKTVVIAGGVGSFSPRRVRIKGADKYEGESIFYRVKDPSDFHGKDLVILGGGDSALDWTLALCEQARSLTLIHRRAEFRAAPASVASMRALCEAGKMTYLQGTVSGLIEEGESLKGIVVNDEHDKSHDIALERLLVFFGLSPKLGPIAEWGLDITRKAINVDTEKFQTNIPGIFAIGDISTYPGKKKLILSGFHEAALAAFAIYHHIHPDEKVYLQYTTTSPKMHERLGVSGS